MDTFNQYSLCMFVIVLLPYVSTNRLQCMKPIHEECYSHRDEGRNDILYHCNKNTLEIKISSRQELDISCDKLARKNEPNTIYLDYLQNVCLPPQPKRFTLEDCSIPDKSFSDIFKSLNISQVQEIKLLSFHNSGDGLQPYHFKHLRTIKSLTLTAETDIELPESLFQSMGSLKKIELQNINAITDQQFESTHHILNRDISSNYHTTFNGEVFRNSSNLESLSIIHTNLSNIPNNSFIHLSKLVSLDLSGNKISGLDVNVFNNLQKLVILNLTRNNLNDLPETFFVGLKSLGSVILDSNNFTYLRQNLFHNCTGLTKLFLKENQLSNLSSSIFEDNVNLRELDLSNNLFISFNDTLFHPLKKLETLKLAGNHLEYIGRNIFIGLTSLINLDISDNLLTDLQEDTFAELKNLNTLDLSNNSLTLNQSFELKYSPFVNCRQLKTLNLRKNFLTMIFADWRELTNLEMLDLSFNKLTILMEYDLIFFSPCEKELNILLNNNKINVIQIDKLPTSVNFNCIQKQKPCAKSIIELKKNPLKCDCNATSLVNYFQGKMKPDVIKDYITLKSIECDESDTLGKVPLVNINTKELFCPYNNDDCPTNCACRYRKDRTVVVDCIGKNMSTFPSQLPKGKSFSIELLLNKNNFKSLNGLSRLFSMVKLTKLSLSFNQLERIDMLKIPTNTLQVLELDNNQLSVLDETTINELKSLKSISLSNNPWQCNCKTAPLIRFLRLAEHSPTLILNNTAGDITCQKDNRLILYLSEEELCRNPFIELIPYISFPIFVILCGCIIALYRIFGYNIKVWLFSHRWTRWLVTQNEIDMHKKYDAFVSFSSKDESFVIDHLIPLLEENGDHHFKLCVHQRDFIVGELITDQIHKCVANSRRTIIVLSSNYLRSEWTRMEFKTAHLRAIKEKSNRVIIVMLEEINSMYQLMDDELKDYLKMHTYVQLKDPMFWEKLRYALPHPKAYSKAQR